MRFGDFSIFLYLGWAVPALMLFYLWAYKREKAVMEKFAQKELLPKIAPFYDLKVRRRRMWMNTAAAALLIFALARPQWGFYWKDDKGKGLDVIIAVDTSKSMLAADMSPNRLQFAKTEIADFVKKLKGDRVGLIAFSGEAFLQCPITTDRGGFLIALNDLNVDTIPRGGTSLPAAVTEAIRSYKGAETANRMLVIITDGENTEGNVQKAADEARKENITVSCIGIGTPEGDVIPILDEKGQKTYVMGEDGKPLKSRLMEETLKALAQKTGGAYERATRSDLGLSKIYEQWMSKFERKETKEKKVKVYKERFQWPLALALLMLVREMMMRGRGRSEDSGK